MVWQRSCFPEAELEGESEAEVKEKAEAEAKEKAACCQISKKFQNLATWLWRRGRYPWQNLTEFNENRRKHLEKWKFRKAIWSYVVRFFKISHFANNFKKIVGKIFSFKKKWQQIGSDSPISAVGRLKTSYFVARNRAVRSFCQHSPLIRRVPPHPPASSGAHRAARRFLICRNFLHIRKSAAPIGFSAVDFLLMPEISQAIFPA